MRDFKDVIYDCIINKDNDTYKKYVEEFLALNEIKNEIIDKHSNKDIAANIELLFKEHTFRKNPPNFGTFRNALFAEINKNRGIVKKDYRNKKTKIESATLSLEMSNDTDSISLIDSIPSGYKAEEPYNQRNIQFQSEVENHLEMQEFEKYKNDLKSIGLKENTREFQIMLHIYNFAEGYDYENLHDFVCKLGVSSQYQDMVGKLLMYCANRLESVRQMIALFFNTSCYTKFIEYLMQPENKKFKIPELITDFNKIRKYLQVLFHNDDINNKSDFVKKCDFASLSSYEKDIHRILSLFQTDKNIFEYKKELKEKTPVEFAKIYDTHNAPSLVYNLLILDLLKQCQLNEVKIGNIVNVLLSDKTLRNKMTPNDIKNFRKYTIRPRLKELEQYGFITIKNNKYILKTKFLNNRQKDILKKVVPVFCCIYPLASIGHFLANRLDINNFPKTSEFNVSNVLDDCITYDLLNTINNNASITLKLRNGKLETLKPIEIYIDKSDSLLKVKSANEQIFYLNEIDSVKNHKKVRNPVFSEIYSYYYKIYEEAANEYKKSKAVDKNNIIKKYGSKDTWIDESIMKMLSMLPNIAIPITTLELRWLKTIMQDRRFDGFVSAEEKQCLSGLINDVDAFDLSSFRIFNYKENAYKSLVIK